MNKNINVLRLAGLLTEAEALKSQGLLVEEDPSQPTPPPQGGMGGPPTGGPEADGPPPGGEGGEKEDPAVLLDKAIELLNKIKETMGGGNSDKPTPPPQGF